MSRAELLAKTAERSPSLVMGNGGKPDVEWTDVNATLGGFAKDKFCAEMFNLLKGPNLRTWAKCDQLIETRQFCEWRERMERLVNAQLVHALSKRTGDNAVHAKLMMQGARAAMWPQLSAPQWGYIRSAVVAELRIKPRCECCKGTKEITKDDKRMPCPACEGTGRQRITDRQRSIAVRIDASNYARHWRRVYEWTYNLVNDAAQIGEYNFDPACE